MNLIWDHPLYLWLIPLALFPFLPSGKSALTISSLRPLAHRSPSWRIRVYRLHRPLCSLLLLGLLLCLAGPTLRETRQSTVQLGLDLMLALDISASMSATDIEPNRMTAAQLTAARFIRGRSHDRVGIILFSGAPYLLAPPTADREWVASRLVAIESDRHGSGTAIGDATVAAIGRLQSSSAKGKAVILLTDGASNRGRTSPETAAQAAAALGIKIYTIGFGTEQGAAFVLGSNRTLPPNHPVVGQKRSTLDTSVLQEMAETTGGMFFRAENLSTLAAVYAQIDAMEKSPIEIRTENSDQPLLPLLLPLLVLLLAIEIAMFRSYLRRTP